MNRIDHLVVGAADLDAGIAWVVSRLGVAPVFGGTHDGFGTRNALLGLGDQYLEVLALDPAQRAPRSGLAAQVAPMTEPSLLTFAVAATSLENAIPMTRVRPDGVRLAWELSFTSTPLFFIDWKDSPHPSVGIPDGGRITAMEVTTPEPDALRALGLDGVLVREGPWHVDARVGDVWLR